MSTKKVITLAFILGLSSPAFSDKEYVGKKVDTPAGTVKVDKSKNGGTTVRGNSTSGPSVNVQTSPKTRDNPKGDTQVTIGVTKEW